MSLAALAIRLAAIRALQGRTYAEQRVFDSRIAPLDIVEKGVTPAIIVTTDDDTVKVGGKAVFLGDHRLQLTIEVVATEPVSVETDDGETIQTFSIPSTDAGLEASLNITGWQMQKALFFQGGPWGDLFRKMVTSINDVAITRGADAEKGVRFAARQYVFEIDHIAEPDPGAPLADVWIDIIEMMEGDNDFREWAKILRAEIEADTVLPWEVARGTLGIASDVGATLSDFPMVLPVTELEKIATGDRFEFDAADAEIIDGPEPP